MQPKKNLKSYDASYSLLKNLQYEFYPDSLLYETHVIIFILRSATLNYLQEMKARPCAQAGEPAVDIRGRIHRNHG